MGALVIRTTSALFPHLPPAVRYGTARVVGELGYRIRPGLRRQAHINYAGVLGLPADSPEVARVSRAAIVGYCKLLADFATLPALTPAQISSMVEVEGYANIEKALEQGKGVIIVTPHFGNWDLAAAAAANLGLKLSAVTDHYGDDEANRLVVAARERLGIKVLPYGTSAGKAVLSALRRNEAVALVCDLATEGRNIPVRIFGQTMMVPAGPALLALRTSAPVIPVMCRRLPDDRYHLSIERPLEWKPAGESEADLHALAQAIITNFEPMLRRYPEQWYLFSPMWLDGAVHSPSPELALSR